jgi:hypothetical protein
MNHLDINVDIMKSYNKMRFERNRKNAFDAINMKNRIIKNKLLEQRSLLEIGKQEILEEQRKHQILEEQRKHQILEEQRKHQILEEQITQQILEEQITQQILEEQITQQILEEQSQIPPSTRYNVIRKGLVVMK